MLSLFSFILFSSLIGISSQAAEKNQQLEELLIWKMSDELKLGSVEEKKFSELIKHLNKRKSEVGQSLNESIQSMSNAKTPKQKDEELAKYRKLLQSYGKISEEEFDRLKSLLGNDRMIQYLAIKQDLTNRIKTMLVRPEAGAKPSKTLPQPKVIIEH
ncbi:hypothetical protein [Bdellovibrio reynosensis]|uniref:Periplasmic heavy metal sensor n=1 Tax=Bdellovibrio reynosensis TaxID=2835041 RepID=A0ABY4CDE7_9BACT|nr:hypothetical protein [Bdellovibrio reynosensis]UOF02967.1 hypothetical protein MNR06_08650 [Bdellovibrio reynosensis]